MRSLPSILLAGALLVGGAAAAQAETSFVCGGIGEAGRAEAERAAGNYAVKLIYAEPTGDYLGNIHTRITDSSGSVVVDTTCEGPWLLLTADPGSYEVTSTYRGETKSRALQVGSAGSQKEVVVTF